MGRHAVLEEAEFERQRSDRFFLQVPQTCEPWPGSNRRHELRRAHHGGVVRLADAHPSSPETKSIGSVHARLWHQNSVLRAHVTALDHHGTALSGRITYPELVVKVQLWVDLMLHLTVEKPFPQIPSCLLIERRQAVEARERRCLITAHAT
eukprot:3884335-Rhodomonas_salina.1